MVDGDSLEVTDSIHVYDSFSSHYVDNLNELEYANGYLYANKWYSDYIYKIDPASGSVIKKWDISTLESAELAF